EMLALLKSAQAETSLQSKVAIVEKLLGNAQVFIKFIASQAGLSQDRQREVRQVAELVTSMTPVVTATISKGRATGSYSLGQGFLNSAASNQLDELLLQLEKLHAEYGVILHDVVES